MANKDVKILIDITTKNQDSLARLEEQFKSIGDAADNTTEKADGFFGSIVGGTLVANALGRALEGIGGAFRSMGAYLEDAALQGQKLLVLEGSLQVVAANAGLGAEKIAGYRDELQKANVVGSQQAKVLQTLIRSGLEPLVNTLEPIETKTRGVVSGMGAFVIHAKNLGASTVDLEGNLVGSERALNLISQALATGQASFLQQLGIQRTFVDSERQMAQSLGKTTGELSEQERMQARLNLIQEEGIKVTGAYDKAYESTAKQLSSLSERQGEFTEMIGASFDPLGNFVAGLELGLQEQLNVLASQALPSVMSGFQGLVDRMESSLSPIVDDITAAWDEFIASLNMSAEDAEMFAGILQTSVVVSLEFVLNSILIVIQAMTTMRESFNQTGLTADSLMQSLASSVQSFANFIQGIVNAVIAGIEMSINAALGGIRAMIGPLLPLLESQGLNLGAISEGVSLGRANFSGAGGITSSFLKGVAGGVSGLGSSFKSGDTSNTMDDLLQRVAGGAGAGGKGGSGSGSSKSDNAAQNALRDLERARIEAIDNESEREVELIKLKYREELDRFKGTEQEKKDFADLLKVQEDRDINEYLEKQSEKERTQAEGISKEKLALRDKLREAEIGAMEDGWEKEQAQAEFKLEKELRDFKGTEKQKMEYKKNLEKQYNIGKQQFAENIIFQGGVSNIDDALARMEQAFNTFGASRLNNFNLGS